MPKHETTPQTIEAIEGVGIKAYAEQRGVTRSFVYALLGGKKLDEYWRFKHEEFRHVLNVPVVGPRCARLFVNDLQAEVDRVERVEAVTRGIDPGLVTDWQLKVFTLERTNAPLAEQLEAKRELHRVLGLYLRSAEATGGESGATRGATQGSSPPCPARTWRSGSSRG